MGYVITTPYTRNPLVAIQKQKAARLLLEACYNALAADGQLDTQAGQRVYVQYSNTARDIEAGKYRKGDATQIPLPHSAGYINIKRV